MSRSRQPAPLPGDLPEAVRILLTELRGMKEKSGHDLRALERETHASRSSWGRWLSGETWIPVDAVTSLAALCGADRRRLEILWEVADEARRPPPSDTPNPQGGRLDGPPTSGEAPEPKTSAEAGSRGEAGATGEAGVRRGVVGEASVPLHGPGAARASGRLSVARSSPRRLLFLGALVGCTFTAATAGMALGATLHTPPGSENTGGRASSAATTRKPVKSISRIEVIARTKTWHPHSPKRVPYDQTVTHHGYRTDGSGYASMALGLPKPGPNSALLEASYCRRIEREHLQPGDLVIKSSGGPGVREVLIFDRWTGPSHTAYWAYQQRRGYGTDHLVRRAGLAPDSGHHGCRPYNLREDQVG